MVQGKRVSTSCSLNAVNMQDSNPCVFDYEVRASMIIVVNVPPSEKLSLFAGEANSQFIVKVLILKLKNIMSFKTKTIIKKAKIVKVCAFKNFFKQGR